MRNSGVAADGFPPGCGLDHGSQRRAPLSVFRYAAAHVDAASPPEAPLQLESALPIVKALADGVNPVTASSIPRTAPMPSRAPFARSSPPSTSCSARWKGKGAASACPPTSASPGTRAEDRAIAVPSTRASASRRWPASTRARRAPSGLRLEKAGQASALGRGALRKRRLSRFS